MQGIGFNYFSSQFLSLFIPMAIINIGASFIFANSSAIALHSSNDKSNASSVVSFVNLGLTFCVILIVGGIDLSSVFVLPIINIVVMVFAILCFIYMVKNSPTHKPSY